MKRRVAKLRLSPNEEARIIREEYERRRKLRIQQVRDQQRCIALQIRREVEQRRQRELEQLEEELRADWEFQQREKLQTLQRLYDESLQLVGQGHRSAKENEPDLAAIARREEENHVKAEERHREALKELKSQRIKDHERRSQAANARKKALQAEKERSAKVASLPLPPPNPIQSIDSKRPHVVKKSDVSAFAATYYHMPESTVDREADTSQPDANEGAELEVRRLQDLQREEKRRREEQFEKARLRGKEALRREHLTQDRERLLVELEHMQQTDLLRRRQQVSQMPPQIFQPLLNRQTREDFQMEMEFAFEDLYTGERRVKGDLVSQLVPEPLPALSTGSQDQDLDITLDEIATQGTGNTQHDAEQEAGSTEQETAAQETTFKPAPRRALKNLLDRIRSQRSQWIDHNSRVPSVDSPTDITDQVPERDTTIDTGSLTSGEKSNLHPIQASHSPPVQLALGTTEQSAAADPLLPDVLANRIQEFEEEQKKREEELEREKQQQVVLLQELDEQKAKLEKLLLEAQQEREDLKAVVTQGIPILNQPKVPVHDQEVTSLNPGLATELVPPSGEDDHTRRVKEYQQRLLEQNRTHQRSVEVARQRLEEYQQALKIRYSRTATSLLPAVPPLGLIHPPLHSAPSVHPPATLKFPTTPAVPAYIHPRLQTPVEVPTRESDMLASTPPLLGSSAGLCSKLLPDEVESILSDPRNQRPDITARLTDNIMERVTEHLKERVRASSEPRPDKLFTTPHSANFSLQRTSDPVQATSLSITDVAQVPDYAVVEHRPKPHDFLQTESLSSREDDDMERQRRELQEVQRRELQEVQRRELQEVQRRELQEVQRRELQEVQRRVLEQREAVALQQRQQEERQRREEERREEKMQQMRRQKETLQALIHTDAQLDPEAASEVLVSKNIHQTRLELLSSLLRAIEASNGGTLSHLEDPEEGDCTPPQPPSNERICQSDTPAGPAPASVIPSGLLPPPRAAKPPVSRFRLGIMEVMNEQHELSAIQEVETPVNTSQVAGPEDSVMVPSHSLNWEQQQESDSSVSSVRTLQSPSWSSSGQQSAERSTGSSSSSSSRLMWRERLLMGAGMSPESSESDSVLRILSQPSSDSGRGADYSRPAITSFRLSTESAHRPPDSDCLSSTTISTGSYVTTDPEQNLNTDKSPLLKQEDLSDVSSPSGQSCCIEDSSASDHPSLAVESLFNDNRIQHIIDRYTRELNISLSAAGRTTDREGSYLEEAGPSVSQLSLVGGEERRGEDGSSPAHQSLLSDTAGAQRSGLDLHHTPSPILVHLSGEELAKDQEQDSFRPLIGQLTDHSSYLVADQRDSAMEQLVGLPSAHSSMIGQLPVPPVSVSFDQGGWDSTLSRMIGRLSHQSSSHWLSGGQDFYAGQLMGQVPSEHSTRLLDGGLEESGMRPLVGELDESAGQHSGSSDERTYVGLGVSTEASVLSYPALPTEASSHSASIPVVNPHPQDQTLHNQTSTRDLGSEKTEVFPDSDSFHPLLAEVTHNETAEPSMTFHLPEHNVPTSPEGQHTRGQHGVSTPSEEFDTHADPSVESELSPERLRAEEAPSRLVAASALHTSFSCLSTSQCHPPHDSVLVVSPTRFPQLTADVTMTALLSNLRMCDDEPNVGMPQPEGVDEDRNSSCPLSDKLMEAAGETGILEQSEITLVSLTDTTLQDQESIITGGEGIWEGEHPDGEEGQEVQETEGSESKLSPEETPEDKNQTHPVIDSSLKKVEQRKPVSEMHQRTRRLYGQLEEVRREEEVRKRREASVKNRLKAKKFNQEIRRKRLAKQTI